MSEKPFSISIEIDRPKKNFRLSAPVFSGEASAPKAIAAAASSLPGRTASLLVKEDNQIFFEEELPSSWGPQPTFRHKVYEFLRRAQRCRHYLRCAANEEKLGDAHSFFDSK